jgi:hypothetical protein
VVDDYSQFIVLSEGEQYRTRVGMDDEEVLEYELSLLHRL